MIHECKVQCYTMDSKTLENMGIEDSGKWLPFIFDMEMVEAAKLSSDEEDSPAYNCTTIFTRGGDTYIIDTAFDEFFKKFREFYSLSVENSSDDEDLEL